MCERNILFGLTMGMLTKLHCFARLSPMSSSLVKHVDVGGEKDDKEKDTDFTSCVDDGGNE